MIDAGIMNDLDQFFFSLQKSYENLGVSLI